MKEDFYMDALILQGGCLSVGVRTSLTEIEGCFRCRHCANHQCVSCVLRLMSFVSK